MTAHPGTDHTLALTTHDLQGSLAQRFTRIVQHTAGRPAVVDGTTRLTYADLDVTANRVAQALLSHFGTQNEPVALLMDHGVAIVAALLGVLKAGKLYCALAPSNPLSHNRQLLQSLHSRLILADGANLAAAATLAGRDHHVLAFDAIQNQALVDAPDLWVPPETPAAIHVTSGSTGTPQGIVRTHRDLLRRAQVDAGFLAVQPADVVSGLYACTFAGSIPDLFGSLLHGAALTLFDVKRSGLAPLAAWLIDHRVTVLHLNATLLRLFLDQLPPDAHFPYLRLVVPSQRLYRADVDRLWPHLPPHAVVGHQYALTEAGPVARWVLAPTTAWHGDIVPAGYPVPDVDVSIGDEVGNPLPAGTPGEIIVRSPYLAAGIWRNAAQTAARFTTPDDGGLRRYRTGDLGRLTPAGHLELLGRLDSAVKVRGHRVVLAEVEAVLESLAGVRQAVVVTSADAGGDLRLTAYVAAPHQGADVALALQQRLRQTLPDYAVPGRVVVMDQLPRLPNGKVDRRALPPPGTQRPPLSTPFRPAGTPLEVTVASIWTQVLGVDDVGIDDHFLALGGHSLQAAQIVNRVVQTCQVDLPLRVLFDAPTVAEMAAIVALQRADGLRATIPPLPHPFDGPLPLSFAQERMWFAQQLAPDASAYNELQAFHLVGPLDTLALRRSLETIVQRHAVLRTTYQLLAAGPVAVVNAGSHVPLECVDLRSVAPDQRLDEARRLAAVCRQQPFDLRRDLMLRAQLLRLAGEEYVVVVVLHRIATDGWSSQVLRQALIDGYLAFSQEESSDLPTLPLQVADFAAWQRQRLHGERLARLAAYWRQRLSGMVPLMLPTDRPRGQRSSQRAGVERFQLAAETVQGLRRLAQESDVTLYVLLLAAFAVLLHRYTDQDDLVIGTPVANRTLVVLEPLIGRFANTLVMRCDLAGNPSFRTLLDRVRQVTIEAYDHQELPFEKLVEELNPARDLHHNPLVQVMFQLARRENISWTMGAVTLTQLPVDVTTTEFDLRLALIESGAEILGSLEYACDLFDPATVARMAGHFQVLLAGIVAFPDHHLADLPLLTLDEQQYLRQLGRGPTPAYPDCAIHQLFEAQAAAAPNAIALVAGDQALTYAELDQRANRVAWQLRRLGIGLDDLVGLCLPRSIDLIVGMLGILKVGAAYLPLDPRDPPARLDFMLRDAGAALVLTPSVELRSFANRPTPTLALDALQDGAGPADADNPAAAVTADHLAYVMFTSGSTGQPKGVEICHRAVNRLLFGVDYVPLGRDTVMLQLAPATFDAATFEIWGALLHGGRLVLAPDGPPDLVQLEASIVRHRVSTLWLTASLFNAVVDHRPALLGHVRHLLTGGEALSPRHVRRALSHLAPDARLVNGYGPTESTTFACCYPIRRELDAATTSIPIGRPIANTEVVVLDRSGQRVPVGVPGELYIGGDGLARGYRQRAALTAERFVPHPFPQPGGATRLYRTGDQVRWLADGYLEFLGRTDHQVKVRGYRVELGEVEAALHRHDAVQACAVVAAPDPAGSARLVALWVPAAGHTIDATALATFLGTLLPAYMVPAQFVMLDALPLTAGGKTDRQALLRHVVSPPPTAAVTEPRTPMEQIVAAAWGAVLPGARIGIRDNFFALGGHSLSAVQVVARLRSQLSIDVPLRIVFEHPTVAGMAQHMGHLLDQSAPPFTEREEFLL